MLSMSIGFNALSNHGACTAIFVAVSAVIGFSIGSIRTLSRVGWIAWAGVSCILTSSSFSHRRICPLLLLTFALFCTLVIIVTIAVGLQDHPSTVTVPKGTKWKSDYEIVASPSFIDASYALSTIVFSFAGTATFFNMISEMRNPRDFNKSLIACQSTVVGIYLLIAIVVYYFCGSYVASPALGSAGPLIKKVCYGIALPGLLASCVILTHVSSPLSLHFCVPCINFAALTYIK